MLSDHHLATWACHSLQLDSLCQQIVRDLLFYAISYTILMFSLYRPSDLLLCMINHCPQAYYRGTLRNSILYDSQYLPFKIVVLQTHFQTGLSVIFLCKDSAGVIRQVPVSRSLLPHKIPTRFPLFLFLKARAVPKQKVVFHNFACNSLTFSFLLPASSILHVKFIY